MGYNELHTSNNSPRVVIFSRWSEKGCCSRDDELLFGVVYFAKKVYFFIQVIISRDYANEIGIRQQRITALVQAEKTLSTKQW